jgi:hypothetical protein
MRKVLIKILLISLLAIDCQNAYKKDENQIKTFHLKGLPEITDIKLSDLGFVDIEYIPLETNELSLISKTNSVIHNWNGKFIVGKNYFLIKYWTTILMFRSDGSFVSRIGTVGSGPDEFLVAHDVDIDENKKNIYLVSGWQKKINVYSDNGEFIRTFKIPLYAEIDFRFVEDKILCYCDNHFGNIDNSFVLMDTDGGIIKNYPNKYRFIKHKDGAFTLTHENIFYRFNNRLFKKEIYSDTIYVFENMDFKPHLVIGVGEKLLTPKARSEFNGFYLSENYIQPLNLFEFGDFIYYEFIYKYALPRDVKIYSLIGSKKNDFQVLINSELGIINDLDGGPNVLPMTILDDNTVITLMDVVNLKNYIASEAFKNSIPKHPEKKIVLEKLANSLKEIDNPVLMIIRLKN